MKLTFTTKDSISKILHTLEKLPSYKSITIYIVPDHEIFLHDRWGKQIHETIQTYQLQVVFSCSDLHSKRYFDRIWLSTRLQLPNSRSSLGARIITFFQQWWRLWSTWLLPKKQWLSTLVFLAEAGVIVVILYIFWWLLSPTALITIIPAHQMEPIVYNFLMMPASTSWDRFSFDNSSDQLVIPYKTGSVKTTESMAYPIQKIDYEITNAVIEATLYNTMPSTYSLIQGTTFVTKDGIPFKTNEAISLPAWVSEEEPSSVTIMLEALPYEDDGIPVGQRWNLQKDAVLYIKQLPESSKSHLIYATPTQLIQKWSTTEHGTVRASDLDSIQVSLNRTLQLRKKELLYQHVKNPQFFVLPFDDMISLHIDKFSTPTPVGSTWSTVEWEVTYSIDYATVSRKDISDAMHTYVGQRPQNDLSLLALQRQSVIFYSKRAISTGVYVVPTKVDLLWWYNFSSDATNLIEDMRSKIAWKTREEAKAILLAYPQVWDVRIRIRPPWYETLPPVSARIDFTRDD